MCGRHGDAVRVLVASTFWAALTDNQPVGYLAKLAGEPAAGRVLCDTDEGVMLYLDLLVEREQAVVIDDVIAQLRTIGALLRGAVAPPRPATPSRSGSARRPRSPVARASGRRVALAVRRDAGVPAGAAAVAGPTTARRRRRARGGRTAWGRSQRRELEGARRLGPAALDRRDRRLLNNGNCRRRGTRVRGLLGLLGLGLLRHLGLRPPATARRETCSSCQGTGKWILLGTAKRILE